MLTRKKERKMLKRAQQMQFPRSGFDSTIEGFLPPPPHFIVPVVPHQYRRPSFYDSAATVPLHLLHSRAFLYGANSEQGRRVWAREGGGFLAGDIRDYAGLFPAGKGFAGDDGGGKVERGLGLDLHLGFGPAVP